jgi:hypothetical protein
MEQSAVELTKLVMGPISALIGWTGFLIVLFFFKDAVAQGFSLAAARVIQNSEESTQRWLIKCLVRKNLTLRELYKDMKAEEDAERSRLPAS